LAKVARVSSHSTGPAPFSSVIFAQRSKNLAHTVLGPQVVVELNKEVGIGTGSRSR